MRLGLRPTVFEESATWSVARRLYGGKGKIWERHRHRYEVNPEYVERLVKSGLTFVGKDEKGERMQISELESGFSHFLPFLKLVDFYYSAHPFFMGLQAHPEFCTRPLNPSPPFLGFVSAACGPTVFAEQLQLQENSYIPPHPAGAMVSEEELKGASEVVSAARGGGRHEGNGGGERHMTVVQKVNKDF